MEADPRHVEIAVRELGVQDCKLATTPGSKESAKAECGEAKSEGGRKVSAQTAARMKVQEEIDGGSFQELSMIGDARNSTGADNEWPVEQSVKSAGEEEELLGPAEARLYRAVAARLNYIAPDRADIAYAVKETARSISAPKASDLTKLRRFGKVIKIKNLVHLPSVTWFRNE